MLLKDTYNILIKKIFHELLSKINNKIHFNYMNKNIKKLLESLFDDDFNDIYVDDTDSDT